MFQKEFYSHLGKLLYAVADIDQVISKEERNALHSIVKKELSPNENNIDEFGTDISYYTEFEFDVLTDQVATSEDTFNSFINFVEENKKHFDSKIKNLTIHLASEIAKAYEGTSKKEEDLIEKLKNKLKEIN